MPPFMPWPMAWAFGQRRSRPWAHHWHQSARVGQEADDGVSGADGGDAVAHLGHHAGDLVAGDQGRLDAAAEGPFHYQQVVMAEAAGRDSNEGVEVAHGGWGQVCNGQPGVGAGLLQDEGFHGVVIRRGQVSNLPLRGMGWIPACVEKTGRGGMIYEGMGIVA